VQAMKTKVPKANNLQIGLVYSPWAILVLVIIAVLT